MIKRVTKKQAIMGGVALAILLGLWAGWSTYQGSHQTAEAQKAEKAAEAAKAAAAEEQFVDLSETQTKMVKLLNASNRNFVIRREAVGNIAFNDESNAQVYPAYQGKILEVESDLGRDVKKGDPLYTIDSPDLLQAESTLIASAGVWDLTTKALERAQKLYAVQGMALKDLQQATSDQQTADAAYRAARDAVRIFGKTDGEMDAMIKTKHVDARLVVRSPITGRVTARNASPGYFVQPGNPPAPFAVANISSLWMVANVVESDLPLMKPGQTVEVNVMAWPGRVFSGKITHVSPMVDPDTHRGMVRATISDPKHELNAGMLANFVIRTGGHEQSIAIPFDGVVREGDGSYTVWATTDGKRFVRRQVKVGMQQDGLFQVLEGVKPGEQVAGEGAIFLSHAFETK
jgi:cobalt-zinc-cadmium efflux system membrane fusion protein